MGTSQGREALTLPCPRCGASHDVSSRPPGDRFVCQCGERLAAPKTQISKWWPPLLVVLVCLPCLAVGYRGCRSFMRYGIVSKSNEAMHSLDAIREAELAHFQRHGTLVAAGPCPPGAPTFQKRPWVSDEGFRRLGWSPEWPVYHQYQVQLTAPGTALLTARGDIDGDGIVAEYRLLLEVGKPRAQPERLTPDEF